MRATARTVASPATLPAQPEPAASHSQLSGQQWLYIATLLVATTIAFSPVLTAQLLSWDDQAYVRDNELLHTAAGLKALWNPATPSLAQYYPMLFTSYWLEYQLWALNGTGYHAVNLALHLINVVLVLLLLHRVGAAWRVAIGAAAIFALHPAQVASVAWVAEQKNTLSGVFYLLAFLSYLRFRESGHWAAYAACLAAFAAALLAKTATLTLPASLLAAEWLLRRDARPRRETVVACAAVLIPMLALGGLATAVTTHVEARRLGAGATALPTLLQRPFIAANALWFYAATFLFPLDLSPMYARWSVVPADPKWWIGVAAWPLVATAIVYYRAQMGALSLWGIAHFLITLTPVLGLIPFSYQQHAFVADHYLYLGTIGGGLALAASADRACGDAGWTYRRTAVAASAAALLAFYGVQGFRESHHWHDSPALWRRILQRDPTSFAANLNLAVDSRRQMRWDDALRLYRAAFEAHPHSARAFTGYVEMTRQVQGPAPALDICNEKLRQDPRLLDAYLQRGITYDRLGQRDEALRDYQHVLRFAPPDSELWRISHRASEQLRGESPK